MNFKSSSAALLLALVLPTGATAATYTHEQVKMMVNSLEATKAARSVATVEVVSDCSGWKGDQARFYHGRKPSIKICAPKMDSPMDLQETVQHEAIHLAQWCNGSHSVYKISSLKDSGRKEGFVADVEFAHEMATKYYPESEYASEFEAYYFMDSAGSVIAEMVNDACK